jgi:glyceraldehyde-3-phosphate dehydrogenase/erythrose-4-phosphate dehydrogenase
MRSIAVISESLDDFDGVLAVNSEPLASCDFLGAEASSIVDTTQTQVSNGHLIKLMIWFDNEWAFVNRHGRYRPSAVGFCGRRVIQLAD